MKHVKRFLAGLLFFAIIVAIIGFSVWVSTWNETLLNILGTIIFGLVAIFAIYSVGKEFVK